MRNAVLIWLLVPLFLWASGCRRATVTSPALPPERVISLAPSLTEIVCAVGGADVLVGRTTACDYPPDVVARIPIIGGFGDPSIELLLNAKPTLILDTALADEAIGRKLSQMGLRRERIACQSMDDIPSAILTVGRYVHREQQAHAVADPLAAEIARLRLASAALTQRPRVFVEIWNDPLTTAGTNSFLSELIMLAGGKNIGDEVHKDYFQVSPEWVVSRDPEVILCFYMAGKTAAKDTVIARSGWQTVAAVRSSRVYDGFDNNLVLRPGPRVLEGISALRSAVAGERGAPSTNAPPR